MRSMGTTTSSSMSSLLNLDSQIPGSVGEDEASGGHRGTECGPVDQPTGIDDDVSVGRERLVGGKPACRAHVHRLRPDEHHSIELLAKRSQHVEEHASLFDVLDAGQVGHVITLSGWSHASAVHFDASMPTAPHPQPACAPGRSDNPSRPGRPTPTARRWCPCRVRTRSGRKAGRAQRSPRSSKVTPTSRLSGSTAPVGVKSSFVAGQAACRQPPSPGFAKKSCRVGSGGWYRRSYRGA